LKREQLRVLERTLQLTLDDAAGRPAAQALAEAHLAAHREVLTQSRQREPVEPDFVHAVDGQRGKPLDQATREIVTLYDYRKEVALAGLAMLRQTSPVDSGAYRDSHSAFVNGAAVEALPALKPGDRLLLSNPVVYARRIEIGRTKSGRAFVMKVQPRIYERSAARLRAIYRNVAKITFGYVDLQGAYVTKGKLASHYGTGVSKKRGGGTRIREREQKAGTAIRYPAIFIDAI